MRIVEVGPRDGLQNEKTPVPTDVKIAFVDALSRTGVGEIEVSAFVSARRVPQLSDAAEVFRRIRRRSGVVYSALVPNETGLERALEAGTDKIAVFTAASETFNRNNIGATLAESIDRFRPVVQRALSAGLPVRGYVSTAFWCAFEGRIAPSAVEDVVQRLVDIGVDELSISDTVGKASPDEVKALLARLLDRVPAERIAVHFHDTYGRGVENVLASRDCGIRIFDASAGGLGGCPFAPGATGNVATEAVVEALAGGGEAVDVDGAGLRRAHRLVRPYVAETRVSLPQGSPDECADCPLSTWEVCCARRRAAV